MKAIRMQKLQAMGTKAPVGKGGGNTYNYGNAGQGSIPGSNKSMPSSMPSKSQAAKPKGSK